MIATMGARLLSSLVGAAAALVGCGRIGVDLIDFVDGSQQGSDSGTLDLDASVDTSGNDAGFDGGRVLEPGPRDAASEDAALADAASDDAALADAEIDAGPQPCDFSGTWATKVEVALTWTRKTVLTQTAIEAGSGTAHVWVRHQSAADGSVIPGSMVGCGVSLPPVEMGNWAGGGTGRVSFDVSLFDTAPPATTTEPVLEVQGDGFPGDPITLSTTAMVLGATLADPLNGAWPAAGSIVSEDVDGDGRPGITLPHLNGNGYVYLPVAIGGATRAEAGYYASRVVLAASGSVVSCSETAGQAQVTRFDSHVLGCREEGGGQCSSAEATLLDDNRPVHTPGLSTYRAVKLAEGDVSCAAVRSALP